MYTHHVLLSVCVVCQTDGATPLYVAGLNGHVEVVRALVGAGALTSQANVRDHLCARVIEADVTA